MIDFGGIFMKKIFSLFLSLSLIIGILSACDNGRAADNIGGPNVGGAETTVTGTSAELGDDSITFGEKLEELGAYNGYFENEATEEITVTCVSGTAGCYTLENGTLTFTSVGADSVYAVSGQLRGNIVIDIGDDYKFDLELRGFSLVSSTTNPITALSGDEVSITAKNEYENYIYDTREAIDDTDETLYSAAVYSLVDLEICGKGALTVISENNNGIHTKDDLQVKNLTLTVACIDNALKGNDSVEITGGNTTLISSQGDCIKTTNSDISEKGNQRGTVTISGGTHTLYAACDGIDASYNVVIDDDATNLTIYTDKYSNYSSEVTAVSGDEYYIRFTTLLYKYSIKYYNSDDDYCWVNAEYHSCVTSGRTTYYYYSFPKMAEYEKMQFFMYSDGMDQGQEEEYYVSTDYLTPNESYDTFALSSYGGGLGYSWTNYTTSIQRGGFGGGFGGGGMGGFGGMNDGNTDKSDYSCKGIKSTNEIVISAGTINIKAYDDAIHANKDSMLENGSTPTGSVTVSGGTLTLYSNDDGLHADGTVTISGGTIDIVNSYEGIEGTSVVISGGNVSVIASDDGVNSTATSGTGVTIDGGTLYIYCSGDGIDANSRTSYSGIVFAGGNTVVISTSSGNSAIDTEKGYKYTGGTVVAVMPNGGMTSEATNCSGFSSVGTSANVSLSSDSYLTVKVDGSIVATVKIPANLSAKVVFLGNKSASISSINSTSETLDSNGVAWKNEQ